MKATHHFKIEKLQKWPTNIQYTILYNTPDEGLFGQRFYLDKSDTSADSVWEFFSVE